MKHWANRASWLVPAVMLFGCATVPPAERFSAGCVAFDVATTAYGLNADSGTVEVNPLIGFDDDTTTVITAVVVSVGTHYVMRRFGAPDWAWWSVGSAHCAAGVWNLSVIEDQ